MNVLLIGSGGREHALALALVKSPLLDRLFVAPGNPGTARIAHNVALDAGDFAKVIAFCREESIGLVAIGPEQPLVDGLTDALEAAGLKVFGPSQAAARLEGSKGFTKDLCAKYHIPTAAYGRFADKDRALAYVREKGAPIVVKADGLAAGKGVVVAMTPAEAEQAVESLFSGAFGAAGAAEAVVEECLDGEEASFFALCDGEKAVAFASAQDHKRVGDGDRGPNTGGMGAYSPAPVMTPEMSARVMREIVEPTVAAMKAEGCPFKGVLFAGLMIGKDVPKLIEYNTRFGDPECQVMMARLEDDLLGLLLACAEGRLPPNVRLSDKTALTVVLAARGYPGTPLKGGRIDAIDEAEKIPGVSVIHAGTKMEGGQLVANGGRVLNVVALADSVAQAQALAYRGVDAIRFPDGFCRRDIGWRAIGR